MHVGIYLKQLINKLEINTLLKPASFLNRIRLSCGTRKYRISAVVFSTARIHMETTPLFSFIYFFFFFSLSIES
jgi:hypothetical protein